MASGSRAAAAARRRSEADKESLPGWLAGWLAGQQLCESAFSCLAAVCLPSRDGRRINSTLTQTVCSNLVIETQQRQLVTNKQASKNSLPKMSTIHNELASKQVSLPTSRTVTFNHVEDKNLVNLVCLFDLFSSQNIIQKKY